MPALGEFGQEIAAEAGEPDTFTFHGEVFELPARLSSLPTMRFAWQQKVAVQRDEKVRRDLASARFAVERARDETELARARARLADAEAAEVQSSLDALAEIYLYIRSCLPDPAEWERFSDTAMRVGSDETELMEVAGQILSAVTARPSRRPSDSSDGPSMTGPSSPVVSASPALGSGPVDYSTPSPTPTPPPTSEPPPAPPLEARPEPRVLAPAGPEPMTELQRQRAELWGDLVSVDELIDRTRSSV